MRSYGEPTTPIARSTRCMPLQQGDELDRVAWGKGTSINMAIQVVAYQAIAMLREELYIMSQPQFQHFPQRTEMNGVYCFLMLMKPNTLYEKRMTKLVKC